MINENFIFLGFAIGLAGGASYIVDVVKGKVKPNRVSWFLWAIAPFIAFAAQVKQGVGLESVLAFSAGFIPLLTFLATFINKKSIWKLTKFDFICGGLSLLGIFFWLITKNPNVAILFAILADTLASLPTIIKSWKEPETENYWVFLAYGINAGIALLIIKTWSFASASFSIYILLICILLTALIKFKPKKRFIE